MMMWSGLCLLRTLRRNIRAGVGFYNPPRTESSAGLRIPHKIGPARRGAVPIE